MAVQRATHVHAEPNPMRGGSNRRQVHKWIKRPGRVITDEKRIQSELFRQPCCCEKMPGRAPRRVDGEHLYGKASPIAELLWPGGLLPVQRADDTLRGSANEVAS
jgi:hypothetical protein